MVPVVILTLLFTLTCAAVIILLAFGLKRLLKRDGEPDKGGVAEPGGLADQEGGSSMDAGGIRVSVVVPFRDEEKEIPGLIDDLFTQTYPEEYFEVLLVNDHSTDGSKEMLLKALEGKKSFRLLDLPEGIRGKKAALGFGISRAAGKWILQTDADCRLRPGFLAARMAHLARNPSDLSAGFVTVGKRGDGFTQIFERLDLLSLSASGAGSFKLGRPLMCSGANLLYSRKLYWHTRPFDPEGSIPSGDDMFLMIGARRLGRSVSFCTDPETLVETAPAGSLPVLLRQRIRWASKAPFYRMADIQAIALLVAITQLSMLLLPLWIVLFPGMWIWLTGAGILKAAADFYLLWVTTGLTSGRKDLLYFLPVSLFYYPFQLLVLAGSLMSRPAWKGRQSTHSKVCISFSGQSPGNKPVRS